MNMTTYPKRTIKHHLVSILLLTVMLFSAVSHTHDFSLDQSQLSEQLDCKLCQQLVETPKQKVKLAKITLGVFSAVKVELAEQILFFSQYRHCDPRAPPHFI